MTMDTTQERPAVLPLSGLAAFSPEDLQHFLAAVKTAAGAEVLGTMESLTMTIMTSIE